ncbi:MAG: hypothetical protein ACQEP1_00440 [Nanobdellota archaeon]
MDNDQLIRRTGEYLDKYLNAYFNGKTDDIKDYNDGGPVVDLHKGKFRAFYDKLPKTSREEQIERLSALDDLHLISVADMNMGAMFGLHVAKNNPNSHVEIQNPMKSLDTADDFHPPLTNDINREMVFKLEKNTNYSKENPENSYNELFKNNGLYNARFNRAYSTPETLNSNSNNIVYHAERINDLTRMLTQATNKNNAGLIMMPLINPNEQIDHYLDDEIINKINDSYLELCKGQGEENKERTPVDNARKRLVTASQLYFTSKLASEVDGQVMKSENKREAGFMYNSPMFYVIKE